MNVALSPSSRLLLIAFTAICILAVSVAVVQTVRFSAEGVGDDLKNCGSEDNDLQTQDVVGLADSLGILQLAEASR